MADILPLETRSAGGVVLNKRGQVLVVNQRGLAWSLPKGHIEEGEGELATARREIHQESGITRIVLIKGLGTYQRFRTAPDGGDGVSEFQTITMFLYRTEEEKLCPVDPDNPEARWVDRGDVAQLLTHLKDKEFFQSILPQI